MSNRPEIPQDIWRKALEACRKLTLFERGETNTNQPAINLATEVSDALDALEHPPDPAEVACKKCGGPHTFDTSINSDVWNAVIRVNGYPDYLCLNCIVVIFAKEGVFLEGRLYGNDVSGCVIQMLRWPEFNNKFISPLIRTEEGKKRVLHDLAEGVAEDWIHLHLFAPECEILKKSGIAICARECIPKLIRQAYAERKKAVKELSNWVDQEVGDATGRELNTSIRRLFGFDKENP